MGTGVFDTKKFKRLKEKWDKRLLQDGFEDIENEDGSLKATTDSRTIKNALREQPERETYYSIAREFLNTYEFPEITVRQIWTMHTGGIGIQTIAKELKLTRYRVATTITELQKLAKLRKK